jgi:hypothetical protein
MGRTVQLYSQVCKHAFTAGSERSYVLLHLDHHLNISTSAQHWNHELDESITYLQEGRGERGDGFIWEGGKR